MTFDFLSLHPRAFGLDLSDRSLKMVYLTKQREGFKLTAAREFALPQGAIEQGEVKQEDVVVASLTKALKEEAENIPTKHVVASLPEEQAFLQVVQLPRMKPEELEHAVRFEAENYIPHALEKVHLDFQVVEPFHNHLDHTDVLLAALPRTTVESYHSIFLKAGLLPQALEIESLALARALVPQETAPHPLLLIDFGATRTSFVIFSGHSLRFTTSIPISSWQLTFAVARNLGVSQEKAEEMKLEYGLERQDEEDGKRVHDALIPALTDLVEQIKRHVTYYESHTPHQHLRRDASSIKRVIVSGGGANLRGFTRFLSQSLEREVMLGNPWVNIFKTTLRELPPLPFGEALRYTAALGLALRGVKNYD